MSPHQIFFFLLVLSFATITTSVNTVKKETCDLNDNRVTVQSGATAWITGLFNFHEAGKDGYGCGQPLEWSMHSYEAVRWVLELLNIEGETLNTDFLNDTYIPGIKLGMNMQDYCSNGERAISAAEDLLSFTSTLSSDCTVNNANLDLGIIGPSESSSAIQVSKWAQKYNIPVVSFSATAKSLSDKMEHPTFMRTVPPIGPHMQVVVDVLKALSWNFFVVVYENNDNYLEAVDELRTRATGAGLCLTAAISFTNDDLTIAGMNSILGRALATGAVGVIYLGSNNGASTILKHANTYSDAGKLQWVFTDSIRMSTDFSQASNKYGRGIITVLPAIRMIVEFEDHLLRIDAQNPSAESKWYKDWYMTVNECRLQNINYDPYRSYRDCVIPSQASRRQFYSQDAFAEPAVHAVFTYARALKDAQRAKCGFVRGSCLLLQQMTRTDFFDNYLSKVDFTYNRNERVSSFSSASVEPYFAANTLGFDANLDRSVNKFIIMNYNSDSSSGTPVYKFRPIGTYGNGQLQLNLNSAEMFNLDRTAELASLPASPCPVTGCAPCLGVVADTRYLYLHGDVIINGIFSLHSPGSNELTCGMFDENTRSGAQYMEAMVYALNRVNTVLKTGSFLRGITLGGLAFDDCNNANLGTMLIANAQTGQMDISNSDGELDPRNIDAYTAAHTSSLTIPIAEFMNELKRPVLGYAATSTELSNQEKYPYFLRAIPSDRMQMRAIALMLKQLGWWYVQTLQAPDNYGRQGVSQFKDEAAAVGVCVVASYELTTDGTFSEIVTKLRSRSDVQPVVVIAQEEHFRSLLEAIKLMDAKQEFILIGTETWGTSQKVVEDLEDIADGSITLKIQSPRLLAFERYLQGLDVNTYTTNPWFKDWYQAMHNCYLDENDKQGYSTECITTGNDITKGDDFEYNPYVIHSINLVYAIAYGLHDTLSALCSPNYNGICGSFTNMADKGAYLRDQIAAVNFLDELGNTFSFSDREVSIKYEIHNFMNDVSGQLNGYKNVGSFDGSLDRLDLNVNEMQTNLLVTIESRCPDFCPECMYLFGQLTYMKITGDLVIPAIFDVHEMGRSAYFCGDMKVANGFQYVEAFRFALEQINSGSSPIRLNGVKLGGLAFDGCSSSARAQYFVSGLHSGTLPVADAGNFQAWMTYNSQSTIDSALLLQDYGLPIVSPFATAYELFDKQKYSTFFRTIPSDTHVARAMAMLANDLDYQYIIVINSPDTDGRAGRDEFVKYMADVGICIAATYEFVTDGTYDQLMKYIVDSPTDVVALFSEPKPHVEGLMKAKNDIKATNVRIMANRPLDALVESSFDPLENTVDFALPSESITAFINHLATLFPEDSKDNPWFREYYETLYKCNLGTNWDENDCISRLQTITSAAGFTQDIRVLSTINAVYAIGKAIENTLIEKCGVTYSGLCSNFVNDVNTHDRVMSHMDAVTFQDLSQVDFRFWNREVDTQYSIRRWSSGTTIGIGGYAPRSGELTTVTGLATLPIFRDVRKTCGTECVQCQRTTKTGEKFTYIPGDIMIAGLFDVHERGETDFLCGAINGQYGAQLLEAFTYAIDYINSKSGIFSDVLHGVRLGGVAFDICKSPTRAGNLVANIHSRNIDLIVNNFRLDPDTFDVYIGALETEASIRVADVLRVLGIPQITYGATSLELRDPLRYYYFMRSVPADDKQARALISFLKRHEINHVQVVNSFDSVGEMGRKEFLRLAYLNRICVTQTITVGKTGIVTESDANVTMTRISSDNANAVLLFLDKRDDFRKLLEAVTDEIADKYFFIGTDRWGYDPEVLKGLGRLYRKRRVVTFDIETADLPLFDKYLEDKTPENYNLNPWFDEYYEQMYECNLPSGARPFDNNDCVPPYRGLSRSIKYVQDPYALYVVNSVFSAALGIHYALENLCIFQTPYYGACAQYRQSGIRRQLILDGIKQVNFTDATKQPFYFTSTGESDRGYHIYEPVVDDSELGFKLQNIGSFNDTHHLKIASRYELVWPTLCTATEPCKTCIFPSDNPSRYMLKESPYDLNIVGFFDVHNAHPTDPYSCGTANMGRGFQNLLAFFYAINSVNNNANQYPANLKLGGLAIDTCSSPLRIGQDIYSTLSGEGLCQSEAGAAQIIAPSTIISYMSEGSTNSILSSQILSPLGYTTISPSGSAASLSNKLIHSRFLRTVPPDNIQALVMIEVLERFGWDFATAVYSDNAYGNAAIQTLMESANSRNTTVCLGTVISMPMNASLADTLVYIEELNKVAGARIVILFVNDQHIRLLLQAAKQRNLIRRFVWLGSDYWADSLSVVSGLEDVASGAITIQFRSENVASFREYTKSLSLADHKGIPDDWFEEYYQTIHKCRLITAKSPMTFPSICNDDEVITDDMIPQDPYVLNTIIATFVIAQGLNDIQICKQSGLNIAACLSLEDDRNTLIYDAILGAQWNVLRQELGEDKSFNFKFTDSGYGDIGYTILNYYRDTSSNTYHYQRIGSRLNDLIIDTSMYRGYSVVDTGLVPLSRCAPGSVCECLAANGSTFSYNQVGAGIQLKDGGYVDPATGAIVYEDPNFTSMSRFSSIWGTIVVTLAAIGAFVTICLFIYLLVVFPNRSGTSILGYLLMFGICTLYVLVFAFVSHAGSTICGIRQFCLGVCYAICYSALFIKLIDSFRSRKKGQDYAVKYTKLGRPMGLLLVACLLIGVQVIISAELLILRTPGLEAGPIFYNGVIWPRCIPTAFYDESLVLSLVYVMMLLVLCIFFGFASWNHPRNMYESRYILGMALLSVPVWAVWCLAATLPEFRVRDAAVAVGLLINATLLLLFGPVRKMYLLSKYQKLIDEDSEVLDGDYATSPGNNIYSSTAYDNAREYHEGEAVRVSNGAYAAAGGRNMYSSTSYDASQREYQEGGGSSAVAHQGASYAEGSASVSYSYKGHQEMHYETQTTETVGAQYEANYSSVTYTTSGDGDQAMTY